MNATKKQRVQAAIQQNIHLLTEAKNKAKEPNISSYTAGMLSLLASLMDKTENMSEAELESSLAGQMPLFIQPRRYPSEIVRANRDAVLKAVEFYNMNNPRIFIEDEDDNILFLVDITDKYKRLNVEGLHR